MAAVNFLISWLGQVVFYVAVLYYTDAISTA